MKLMSISAFYFIAAFILFYGTWNHTISDQRLTGQTKGQQCTTANRIKEGVELGHDEKITSLRHSLAVSLVVAYN